MLGFDALGKLALGQLRQVVAQSNFTSFPSQVFTKKVDVNSQTEVKFRILRPDSATPGPLVFTKFSEPTFIKKVDVNAQTEVRFRILRPDAATPGPLVFSRFSDPHFPKIVNP